MKKSPSLREPDPAPICNLHEHVFLPVLEVHDPLLRCVRCQVFAYQETVKQLAKRRSRPEAVPIPETQTLRTRWIGRLKRLLRM